MKRYEGHRQGYAVVVTIDGKPLNPRLDLYNHSPTGFEWGYGGQGPRQLAAAILIDYLGDPQQARSLSDDFEKAVVKRLPRDKNWVLTADDIEKALQDIANENKRISESPDPYLEKMSSPLFM